jgi:hypothetical protein
MYNQHLRRLYNVRMYVSVLNNTLLDGNTGFVFLYFDLFTGTRHNMVCMGGDSDCDSLSLCQRLCMPV